MEDYLGRMSRKGEGERKDIGGKENGNMLHRETA
jgi:hypothetical protein